MLRFISWNVNGLRACVGKDFENQFKELDADFFCLQETKMQEGQLDLLFEGYESYWNYAEKKGYSGTAIYTKHKPLSVSYGMGIEEHDHEGRIITLEYDQFYLVTCYIQIAADDDWFLGIKRFQKLAEIVFPSHAIIQALEFCLRIWGVAGNEIELVIST